MRFFLCSPLLLLVVTSASATSFTHNGWSSSETDATFAAWPEDMQKVVDSQVATHQEQHAESLPVMRVFTSFPEPPEQSVWPLLHGMAKRLDPLFSPHATFHILDGAEYGCRKARDNGVDTESEDLHVPVESEHCHNHCIRQGRYCAPQKPEDLPENKHGRDIVQEVFRRICFMHHYHATGTSDLGATYYDYVQAFDKRDCFFHANFTQCSYSVMEEVGAPAFNLEKCLQSDLLDKDIKSETLDSNLELLGDKTLEDMPQVEINEKPLLTTSPKEYTAATFFFRYCDSFGTNFKQLPLACQVCEPCEDIRSCLWTLKCDGSSVSMTPPDQTDDYYSVPSHANEPNRTPDTEHKDTVASNANSSSSKSSSSGNTSVIFFMIVAISCLLAVAVYMFLDLKAKRQQADDADKTKVLSMAGSYYDENRSAEETTIDYTAGESVRRKKESPAPKDLVDLALDKMGDDVMGEESEWAENKRSTQGIV